MFFARVFDKLANACKPRGVHRLEVLWVCRPTALRSILYICGRAFRRKISDTRESQSPSPPRSASRKRRGPPRTPSCCCRVPARWGERAFAHVSRDTGRPRGGHAEPVISCGCLWERAGAVGVACEGVAGRAPWAVMMRATGGEVPGRLAGMDGALSSPRLAAKPPDAPPTSALPGAPAAMPPPPDGQRPASYCAARGGEPQRGGESLRTMPPPLAPAPSWALAPS